MLWEIESTSRGKHFVVLSNSKWSAWGNGSAIPYVEPQNYLSFTDKYVNFFGSDALNKLVDSVADTSMELVRVLGESVANELGPEFQDSPLRDAKGY